MTDHLEIFLSVLETHTGIIYMDANSYYSDTDKRRRLVQSNTNHFFASMGTIVLRKITGLSNYLKHLIRANNINYEGSVITIQQQLLRLEYLFLNTPVSWCYNFRSGQHFIKQRLFYIHGGNRLLTVSILTDRFSYLAFILAV